MGERGYKQYETPKQTVIWYPLQEYSYSNISKAFKTQRKAKGKTGEMPKRFSSTANL